jgi:hypothetical protein
LVEFSSELIRPSLHIRGTHAAAAATQVETDAIVLDFQFHMSATRT